MDCTETQWGGGGGGGTDVVYSKAPTPEGQVRPPIKWGWWPMSPPATPLTWGAESGTDEGAEKENGLVPKLPN